MRWLSKVKVLSTKLEYLSLIPQTYERNEFHKLSSYHHLNSVVPERIQTINKYNKNNLELGMAAHICIPSSFSDRGRKIIWAPESWRSARGTEYYCDQQVNSENIPFCGCRHTKQKWEWRWSRYSRLSSSMPQACASLQWQDNVLCFLTCRTKDFLLRQHLPEPSAFLALTQCSRGQSSSLAAWLLVFGLLPFCLLFLS